MRRMSTDEFMAEVLAGDSLRDLPAALRERLLGAALASASARVGELKKAFEEAARG